MKKQTDLLKPTPAQIKHRNRLWADALLKNKRKARGKMYDSHGGRCCLAVAQDVAISCGLDKSIRGADDSFPHDDVGKFFGWGRTVPYINVKVDDEIVYEEAATVNDGEEQGISYKTLKNAKVLRQGLSHKQIAECVLNTYVHPTKFKQSFKLD